MRSARPASTDAGSREAAWKNTEVDALYQLVDAGVRVPQPYGYFNGVLVMELVVDADGHAAPRLGEVELSPLQARGFHRFLVHQVQKMLCIGLIHGDLSNTTCCGARRPGSRPAAGGQLVRQQAARAMLRRDVGNLTISLARFAPELLETHYAEEMWGLFEQGELRPDTELTGEFVFDDSEIDIDSVELAIRDAREEAIIRQQGREAAAEID